MACGFNLLDGERDEAELCSPSGRLVGPLAPTICRPTTSMNFVSKLLNRLFRSKLTTTQKNGHTHATSKQEKMNAKEASSATSIMASSLKSTLGSLFESSAAAPPASTASPAPAPSRQSLSVSSSVRSTSGSSLLSPLRGDDASAAAGGGVMGAPSPSVLSRFSAMKNQMPSLRDLLFDDAPPASGSASGSRASSRHGGGGGSRHSKLPSSTNKSPSESGVTVRVFCGGGKVNSGCVRSFWAYIASNLWKLC